MDEYEDDLEYRRALEKNIVETGLEKVSVKDLHRGSAEINSLLENNLNENLIEKEKIVVPKKLFDQLIEDIGYGKEQWILIIVTAMNFILQGIYFYINTAMFFPVKNYYNASDTQIGVASSMVYLSGIFTSVFLGYLTNIFGRIKLVIITTIIITLCHVGICLIHNFTAFCVFLFIIGGMCNINGPILINILAEYVPVKYRAFTLGTIWGWYFIGSIFLLLIYLFYMPHYEMERFQDILWMLLVFPIGTYALTHAYLKDSPRSLVIYGDENEAIKLISKMYSRTNAYKSRKFSSISDNYVYPRIDNRDSLSDNLNISFPNKHERKLSEHFTTKPSGTEKTGSVEDDIFSDQEKNQLVIEAKLYIVVKDPENLNNNARFKDLYSSNYFRLTVSLSIVWLTNSIVCYGPFFIMPLTVNSLATNSSNQLIQSETDVISSQLWVTCIALLANPLGGYMCELEYLGRKNTSALASLLSCVVCTCCFFNIENIVFYMGLLNILNTIAWNSTNTYTAEVYPTHTRNLAVGYLKSIGNAGSMISQPLFVLINTLGIAYPYLFTVGFAFISFVGILFFPFETRGKELDFEALFV